MLKPWSSTLRSFMPETIWTESQHHAPSLHFNEFICVLVHHYLSMAYWCDINMSSQHFGTWLLHSVLSLEAHERLSLHVVKEIRKGCESGDSWIKSLCLKCPCAVHQDILTSCRNTLLFLTSDFPVEEAKQFWCHTKKEPENAKNTSNSLKLSIWVAAAMHDQMWGELIRVWGAEGQVETFCTVF